MKHLLSISIIHRLRTWLWVTLLGIIGVSCGLEDGTITGTDFEREYLRQLPPQRSTIAPDIDSAYYLTFWVSVVFFVAIVAAMGYFIWKYRRSVHPKPEPTGHNDALEIFWTVTPVILLVIIFVIGWDGYMKGVQAPENALDIRVEAAQWKWEIEHENGVVESCVMEDGQRANPSDDEYVETRPAVVIDQLRILNANNEQAAQADGDLEHLLSTMAQG